MSMKIVVINGSERKGSTYHFTQLLIEQMEDVQATEFFYPKICRIFAKVVFRVFQMENKPVRTMN
ncbi:MAG: hypothetical protein RR777_06170 [Christensenellaceae bacterium]